ncbi:MAG TPA: hypothetical protein VF970_01150 [Gemmatimonadales bacterium]
MMSPKSIWRLGVAAMVGWSSVAAATPVQEPTGTLADRALASRDSLEAFALSLEQNGGPEAAALVLRVRARLQDGDFRPGDRILLVVHGESALTDTFTVGPGTRLQLPPPVPESLALHGVLRSELDQVVRRFVGEFVQQPVTRAEPLVRLAIQGEVAHAGIHYVPASAVLADALMVAGGATARADLRKLKVEREGETLWEGGSLQRALADGVTIDGAWLRHGDRMTVGARRDAGVYDNIRFLWIVVSLAGGIYGLSRAF